MSDLRMISAGFVEDALESLRDAGLEPGPLLAAAGLPQWDGSPVDHLSYGRLWLEIAEATGDEFFGQGDRAMRPGSFALMCHAVLHSGRLDRALARALRFLNVVLDAPRGALMVRNGQAEISLADGGVGRSAFAYRTYWIILMGVACWLAGRRIALRRVDFACPAPEHRQDYHQFFGAPVTFGVAESRLVFDAAYLRLPIVRTEEALKTFLRDAPANILVRYHHDQETTAAVRSHLKTTDPVDWPTFEELSRTLVVSPATLRRRLRSEGQSYAEIKGELRAEGARELLRGTDLSVAEIAGRLGYSEPSAFYRAFHKWFGRSPGEMRDSSRVGRKGG